ncbi:DUF4249 domain-containing protein [Galbibacter sp. EGI 63066]|uniref:DUF4249 domain-containing protein n=1 Tax=Galbibacter sp. EGI 63066 TaxID=2993559 RepID=UPI002248D693|nr:DUF4249 domain-containing protein [Galbibacter sp. EGI 63066]MCX2682049.1 DUF4249 domain-containing protein [Galbibacter sp. EGI 63066]
MKKSIYTSINLFVAFLMLTSCEDSIDLDLDTTKPRLVIDAGIAWEKGTDGAQQTIKISTTTDYYATEIPPVSNATVSVTNSEGIEFQFVESQGTGEYVCTDFIPEINETYELMVLVDGQTYTASEQLVATPEITHIVQNDEGGFFGENIEIKFYYQDNGEEDNFYLSEFNADFLSFPEHNATNDDLTQGNEMFESFIDEDDDLETGDEIYVSLRGMSEQFYNYMTILLENSGGNPFNTPSANVRGNIINQTDEGNYALGYFRLSEMDSAIHIVE